MQLSMRSATESQRGVAWRGVAEPNEVSPEPAAQQAFTTDDQTETGWRRFRARPLDA